MTQSSREVVEIVVEPIMPAGVGGVDARDGVEFRVQAARLVQVQCPVGDGAADPVGGVGVRGRGAGICWFEGVDGVWLDEDLELGVGEIAEHAFDDLAGDLRGDHVVGHAVFDG